MKFQPIDPTTLPQKNARQNSETTTLLNEFLQSGAEVAELDPEGKKVETVRTSIQNAINRIPNGKAQVRVMSRGGRLFLARVAANGNVEPSDSVEAAVDAAVGAEG